MATDVKLDQGPAGNTIVLDGGAIQATATDFLLDFPSRHVGPPGLRRALVHDFSDGLTMNWAGDYPGGVTINGPKGTVASGPAPQIRMDLMGAFPGGNSGFNQVTITGTVITLDTQGSDPNSAGDVKFTFEHPSEVDQDGNPRTEPFPETILLGEVLTTLRDTVAVLQNQVNSLLQRVAVLESK